MLVYEEALARVLQSVTVLEPARTPLAQCLGRFLAEDVVAKIDLPPFANSAMDGFAIICADTEQASSNKPVRLQVIGEIAAGSGQDFDVVTGSAVRIFTGSRMPRGADSVVPIEDVIVDGTPERILVDSRATKGQFVRQAGTDAKAGTVVIRKHSGAGPPHIAMAAATGSADLVVTPAPKVAVISTGSELVPPGESSLEPGQIYESNSFTISALATQAGADVVSVSIAPDDLESLVSKLSSAAAAADVVISSGGVSVGDHDLVKAALGSHGSIDFWRAAVRPGKPFAFGHWGSTLFFGLPGNPGSAIVTFELFVRPALRKLAGADRVLRPMVQARIEEPVSHEPGRRSFIRARTVLSDSGWSTRPNGSQGSHQISAFVQANSFIVMSELVSEAAAGALIDVMLLEDTSWL